MLALTFQVGKDRVAVDVQHIREVVPRVHLQTLAGSPAWLAGLFVHRGRVVPVIDLFRLTGSEECPPHLSSRIILVPRPGQEGSLLGLLATQVADLREIPTEGVSRLQRGSTNEPHLGSLLAEGANTIRLLNPMCLLPAAAMAMLNSTVPAGAP